MWRLFRWRVASSIAPSWRLTANCTRLVMATTVDLVSARLPTRSCLNACRHWTAFISATYALLQSLSNSYTHTHTHTHLTALFPGLPRLAGTRKVKPVWILLMQETVSGSGISWAICKSAPRSTSLLTTQFFYRPDALPAVQPTASKHWRQFQQLISSIKYYTHWLGMNRMF